MRHGLRHSQPIRFAAACIVALALFVKLLIAPGMMPVADAGGIRITICTGAGAIETLLDPAGKQHGDQGKAAHEPCPFGLLAMAGVATGDVEVAVPALLPSPAPAALPPLPARAPPAASPPPSTGPPALA